jgi:type IV pilus assembly protein PilA
MKASGVLLTHLLGVLVVLVGLDNFEGAASRSKQSEARANLKALYWAELAYRQDKDTFTASIPKVGFVPDRGNRYRYDLSNETLGNLEDRSTKDTISHPDDTGIAEDTFKFIPWPFAPYVDPPFVTPGHLGHFRASAQADLDGDLTIDQWSIASYDRYTRDGVLIAKAGEPYCDVDDSVQ